MKRHAHSLKVDGFVLAGGRSIRMGQDKALLELDGMPLVRLALSKLSAVTGTRRIVGDRPDLSRFAPVVMDLKQGRGPLRGIAAALLASDCDWNVILAVDLPLLPAAFLGWLVSRVARTEALATVPLLAGLPQPLIAVYHRALLPELERSLRGDDFKTIDAITGAAERAAWPGARTDFFRVETLAAAGQFSGVETEVPVSRWFENVNSPLDFACCVASERIANCNARSRHPISCT